ncbi:unnamed protein product, partial [Ascophyllum nodosum]
TLHGRQTCAELNSFHQGVGQICRREGLFSCRPLPKRGQTCDIPSPIRSTGKPEDGEEPASKYQRTVSAWIWRMIGLTRDETAKPITRDQILGRDRGQKNPM